MTLPHNLLTHKYLHHWGSEIYPTPKHIKRYKSTY